MEYIIGVDGGATKTEAVAYDLDNNAIGKGCCGFGNLFLDFNKATENITDAIKQCIKSIEQDDSDMRCLGIYLGLAGIDVGDNKEKIETLLKEKFCCKVYGFHDSYLAHAAIHKGEDGIIVVSGTGSVSYGIYKGMSAKSGGWGHIIGDEGSGYNIAISAFKKIALDVDNNEATSELAGQIMAKMNIKDVEDIVILTYSYSKAEISAFVPIIAKLAEQGDINSIEILKQAGQNLAQMAVRLYRKLEIDKPINIGISGSILYKVDIVAEELISRLMQELKDIHITTEIVSATKGACYLHTKLSK